MSPEADKGEIVSIGCAFGLKIRTTSIQEISPQSSELLDPSQSDPITNGVTKAMCFDGLQEKLNKFLSYKRHGKGFNAQVRNRKEYGNPDFLVHAVRYEDIDQTESCFSKMCLALTGMKPVTTVMR